MNFLQATRADLETIYTLGKSSKAFEVSDGESFWDKEELAGWIRSASAVFLVAKENDQIVGFVLGGIEVTKATIHNIFVVEQHRGIGISEQLMATCLQKLKQKGVTYVSLLTKTDNNMAKNFFKKTGFKEGYDFTWYSKYL